MRINLVSKRSVDKYIRKNNQVKSLFYNWIKKIGTADWNSPHDIKETFGSANHLGKGTNRVVFNIGGNRYRIICSYFFGKQKVQLVIKWIGTHAEYTKLCLSNKQYSVEQY